MNKKELKDIMNRWYVSGRTLTKAPVDPKKHLLHKYGGVPAVPVSIWDEYAKIFDDIRIKTKDGTTFAISRSDFSLNKEKIQNPGFEAQYVVPVEHWKVTKQSFDEYRAHKVGR